MRAFLENERIKMKEFAKMLNCTPQHLSGVMSGRIPLSDAFLARMEAAINKYNDDKFKENVTSGALRGQFEYVQYVVRFTSWEWQQLISRLPKDFNLEGAIRDYVMNSLVESSVEDVDSLTSSE